MSEHVLQSIGELERIDIAQSELNVRVDDELRETEDFSTQVERVSESRLLPLLSGKRLDRLQIEVVIEMQVVQVLSVDQQVEHVVSLSTDLKTGFHPVQRRRLEEFGVFERPEQVSLGHGFGWPLMQGVQYVYLELEGR